MKSRLIIGLAVIVVIVGIVLGVLLGGGGGLPGEINVPINAAGANNIGALHIELGYDPAVLEATGVENGKLADNAMMEYKIYDDGCVVVSMVDSAGMNGEGSLAVVTFKVLAQDNEKTTALGLQNLRAWDANDLFEVHTEFSDGSYIAKDGSFTSPVIIFAP